MNSTYLGRHITDAEHLDVHGQLDIRCLVLCRWCLLRSSPILLPGFDLLVLERGHGKQVLEEKVEEDQRIELEVAVVGLLEGLLGDLDHNLRDVETFVGNELSLHLFAQAIWHLIMGGGAALWELVDRLARAALDKVTGQRFQNLMCLHSHVGLSMLQELQEHDLEVVVGDQVCEHPDMCFSHQPQGIDEELELVDEKLVHVDGPPEVKLGDAEAIVVLFIVYDAGHAVSTGLLVVRVDVLEKAELGHHLEVSAGGGLLGEARSTQIVLIHDLLELGRAWITRLALMVRARDI